jgi:hypothetical protein
MKIPYEDRTVESTEDLMNRRVYQAGQILIQAAIQVSNSTPAVGLSALALALGQGTARTGASIDEVIDAVRHYYGATLEALSSLDDDDDDDTDDDEPQHN